MTRVISGHLWRLPISLLLAVMLLLQSCDRQSTQPKYSSVDYNVILISIDTLRADHLGVYGYPKDTSPNIDSFAADSLLFETAIAQAPSTLPSHASLFTGMIPVNHGSFAALQTPIKPELPTISEIFRDAGFRTISFNGGGLVGAAYGFGRGFEEYATNSRNDFFRHKVDAAINWLEENSEDKFFMFLHTYEVHDPYAPEDEYLELFETDYSGKLTNNIGAKELSKINSGNVEITEADIQHVRDTYNGEIRSMDKAFGRLIAYLRNNDLYDNTVIIFTSDHGEEFGEHGNIGRHFFTLYDELLHVPFIIKMPDSQLAGRRIKEQVRGIDVLPTLLDVLAINYESDFDGQSLVSLMAGEKTAPLIAVSQQDNSDPLPPTSIRTNKRKLVLRPNILADSQAPYVWVKDKLEFHTDSTLLTIPLASVNDGGLVRILVNNYPAKTVTLSQERENHDVIVIFGGQPGDITSDNLDHLKESSEDKRLITIESLTPCVSAAEAGIDTDIDCVSFRVFNPQEYYLLDTDPKELLNRYGEAEYSNEISALSDWLSDQLSRKPNAQNESIQIDEETRRQLESLGYLN